MMLDVGQRADSCFRTASLYAQLSDLDAQQEESLVRFHLWRTQPSPSSLRLSLPRYI
jgi:hypothetical protein